jgi:hypothetical protein
MNAINWKLNDVERDNLFNHFWKTRYKPSLCD